MLITLSAFLARNNGKYLDFDHAYGAQCVDLVQCYLRDVLGDPPLGGNAINEFGEDSPHWVWVRNNPNNPKQLPPRGAVMIWGPDARIGTGVYGHTAVVIASDTNGFNSFDQNWPLNAPCHNVRHSYLGIIGWGIPRTLIKPPLPPSVKPPVVPPPVIIDPPAIILPPPDEKPPIVVVPSPVVIPQPSTLQHIGCMPMALLLLPFAFIWRNRRA